MDLTITVNSIIMTDSWFLDEPSNGLNSKMKKFTRNVHLPTHHSCKDSPSWGPGKNQNFSSKTAYDVLSDSNLTPCFTWGWLWKLRIRAKITTFFWLLIRDRLMSNSLRAKINMCDSSLCARCNVEEESSIHITHDSLKA